jgi:hypothetical protein
MLKAVAATFVSTLAAIALAAQLFLNSILGLFGLAAESVETLSELRASHAVVQKVKARHKMKSKHATKRLMKRSRNRVAATTLAASTIGTVAVAATMITLEAQAYCDEQKELLEDTNVLFGEEMEFDYEQCLEVAKEDFGKIIKETGREITQIAGDAVEGTAEYAAEVGQKIKEYGSDAIDSTVEASSSMWDSLEKFVADLDPIDFNAPKEWVDEIMDWFYE